MADKNVNISKSDLRHIIFERSMSENLKKSPGNYNLYSASRSNLYSVTEGTPELKQIYDLLQSMTKTCLNIATMNRYRR